MTEPIDQKDAACEEGPRHRKPASSLDWILSATAYFAVGGVALAQVLSRLPAPRLILLGALLAGFAAALVLNFGHFYRPGLALFAGAAVFQTLCAVGVMVFGPTPLFGAILFFVLNTIVTMRLPQWVGLAWGLVPVASLTAILVLQGQRDWLPAVLTFSAGFYAFIAFALALRQAQQARAESQQLLRELVGTQGRLRELAVLEERQRLAREMHDAVGHRLTAASVLLEGAARLIRGDPDRATRMVETSREQVKEGLAEIRAAVTALREGPTGSQPLAQVLRALVDVFAQASQAQVTLTVEPGALDPDPERRIVIVRTAQEALTNVQKHAAASMVELSLGMAGNAYVLTCRDNGRGLRNRSEEGEGQGGYGLANLRERAATFGGRVELEPGPEGGSLLRLTLPTPGDQGHDGR